MPDEQNNEEGVINQDPVKGKIIYGKGAISLPTPSILLMVGNWIQNVSFSLITLLEVSDLFAPHANKIICFSLSAIYIMAGGSKKVVGIDNSKKN